MTTSKKAPGRHSRTVLQLLAVSSVAATLTVYVTSTNATIGTLTDDGSGRFRGNLNFGTNPGNITVKSSGGGSATRSVIAK